MLNEEDFCEYLKRIVSDIQYYGALSRLGEGRSDNIDIMPETLDIAIDLLEQAVNDTEHYVSWWLFEKECGKREDMNVYEFIRGQEKVVPTKTEGDLYRLITKNGVLEKLV
ncbi:MAG: hypothetical protein J6O00_10630 [Clostridiales bacterium]|nr:hypothetical protein [Clostridiales bacterium]